MPDEQPVSWRIIVPLKALPGAKSRLLGAGDDLADHASLVAAIRADTVASAAQAGHVVVVSDRPIELATPTHSLIQSAPGLNAALAEAAAFARLHWPADAVAALVGDLPALLGSELVGVLALAAQHPRAFVADASGLGTTLLTALPGIDLHPQFGPGSARRHAVSAVRLPAPPGVRLDVDTADDLVSARALGLGPATKATLHW